MLLEVLPEPERELLVELELLDAGWAGFGSGFVPFFRRHQELIVAPAERLFIDAENVKRLTILALRQRGFEFLMDVAIKVIVRGAAPLLQTLLDLLIGTSLCH